MASRVVPGHTRNDGPLVAQEDVEERALAHVRPAHDGHADGHPTASDERLLGEGSSPRRRRADPPPPAVLRRDAHGLAQAQVPSTRGGCRGRACESCLLTASTTGTPLRRRSRRSRNPGLPLPSCRRGGRWPPRPRETAICGLAPYLVPERLVAPQVDAAGVDHDEAACRSTRPRPPCGPGSRPIRERPLPRECR